MVDMMDPETHKKYEEKRVTIRNKMDDVPYYGLVYQIDYQMPQIRSKVEKVHVSSKKEVVKTIEMIAEKAWQYEKFKLFHVGIPQTQLPM